MQLNLRKIKKLLSNFEKNKINKNRITEKINYR